MDVLCWVSAQALRGVFDDDRWSLDAEVRGAAFFRSATPREPRFGDVLPHLVHFRFRHGFVHDAGPFAGQVQQHQEHSVILTAHRKPFYNREKRNPSPIAKDFRWAQHRLSRYPMSAQAVSGRRLRDDLHTRFDQWLDRLQEQLPDPQTSLADVTEAVWHLRQELTGGVSETIVAHAHGGERTRQYARCPQCHRRLTARPVVSRTVETMVGPVQVERPYFYCTSGCGGVYPFDNALELAPGRKQLDVQQGGGPGGDRDAL